MAPMTASREGADPAAIVRRLRAAGCVFAEDESDLLLSAAETPAELEDMVERRAAGLPLEQVVGWAELCGRRVAVEPGVFVPRHRTELLVREATALCRPGTVVLDLCCGSGAIGVVLAAAVAGIELHASDIDPAAVRCARRSIGAVGGCVYEGDLYDPLPSSLLGRVDVLAANVPYVPSEEIDLLPREARLYEPRLALDGGADGLELVRRVADGACRWLAPGGGVLVETGEHQAPLTAAIFSAVGLRPRVARSEELEATVIVGVREPGDR